MCRLAAFPPNFPRIKALNILLEFEGHNTDGFGYTYIKDGKFVTHKWPRSISSLLKRGKSLLAHMPFNGWTIAHLRAASHGENKPENTHPFEIGKDWSICHNGIWSEYNIAKLALTGYVQFKGETDSEVAAHLINNLGPQKFAQSIDMGGVFLGLNLDGSLWVMKTSGDLVLNTLKNDQVLIASELDLEKYPTQPEALEGWYHFDKDGKYLANKENPPWYVTHGGGSSIGLGLGTSSRYYESLRGPDTDTSLSAQSITNHSEFDHRRVVPSRTGTGVSAVSKHWSDWPD